MAGVAFSFYNFAALIDLNIGMAYRLDENRSESFTILFCDFTGFSKETVKVHLPKLLRTSDSIVHYEHYYFLIMPNTDRYGTQTVKRMIEEAFAASIASCAVCYPSNGENSLELLESLHAEVKKMHRINLDCLYSALNKEA
ncbi:MAG: hypothetical protein Q8K81_05195 [Sulfuricurvum sp.]|nr:hypothetical protein [Sulfuricurvum sp.]